jgi:hypothetical protein
MMRKRILMTKSTIFSIDHSEGFPLELCRSPKKVRNAYQRTVIPLLQSLPTLICLLAFLRATDKVIFTLSSYESKLSSGLFSSPSISEDSF